VFYVGQKNPFVPEIPCHRIVAASRAIGGYKGSTGSHSVDEKIKLLTKEGVTFVEDPNKVVLFFFMMRTSFMSEKNLQVDASCIYLYD
jgi:alkylated DNA nucleotide flippase Atl1